MYLRLGQEKDGRICATGKATKLRLRPGPIRFEIEQTSGGSCVETGKAADRPAHGGRDDEDLALP